MKKIFIIIASIVIIFGVAKFYSMSISGQLDRDNSVKAHIEKLAEENPKNIYDAFFSLDELRPFSIIQFDKFSSNYDKKWIDPQIFVQQLNNTDKELIRSKIEEYIESLKDAKKQNDIINKLYFFCYNEYNLSRISGEFSINQDTLTAAALNTDILKSINAKYLNQSSPEFKKLSPEEYKIAYYDMLNLVSSLKPREQFAFYSTFYKELSTMGGY